MVGAVIVRDGSLVSVGHHARFGLAHAEVMALADAAGASRGADLYVTLEPCCHQGKTPPCTRAVIDAGIKRVVAAMEDPFPRVAGGGLKLLRDSGLQVEVGLLADEARLLNAPYLKRLRLGRPYVTGKWAMTLDGRMATASGSSRWISGSRSRAVVHEIRGRMDAIIIGVGTAIADDPQLTARPAGSRILTRVVLDSSARLPVDSTLVKTANAIPTLVAVTRDAPKSRCDRLREMGCEVLAFDVDGRVPIGLLLDEMGRRSWTNVLVEGGGRVLGAFLDAGEVDAVEVFIAPILEGGAPSHVPFSGHGVATMDLAKRLEHVEIRNLDGDIHVSGQLPHPWLSDAPA